MAKDWRRSWLAVEFRCDCGGEERGIESCEAVSASSSSDSRKVLRGSEFVGDGGGKKLETMVANEKIGFPSYPPVYYIITDCDYSSPHLFLQLLNETTVFPKKFA